MALRWLLNAVVERSLTSRPLTAPWVAQYHAKPRDKKKIAARRAALEAEKSAAHDKYQPFKEVPPLEDIVASIRSEGQLQPVEAKPIDVTYDCQENPFRKEQKKCILCEHNIQLDYKNVRLLSQFVSPFSGRLYGNAVTGLCIPMQRRIAHLVKRARKIGLMPYIQKDPQFLTDPELFSPFKSRN